ncbi:MAG: PD-(D/E)XK nuclease family protein, partial [bacterium]
LHVELKRHMDERFGPDRLTVLRLQEESLRQRLAFFSKLQAKMARDGWRILQPEVKANIKLHGTTVSGKIDRIDFHAEKGCRILDYKTWGKAKGIDSFCASSKKVVERSAGCGLRTFEIKGKDKPAVWTDLQLPLYRRLVESLGKEIPAGPCKFECGYFVLGDTESDTVCETWDFDLLRESSDTAIQHVIERVRAGIFWPIIDLVKEFEPLFPAKPEEGVALEWIADQEARLARLPPVEPVPPAPPPDTGSTLAPKKATGKGKKA